MMNTTYPLEVSKFVVLLVLVVGRLAHDAFVKVVVR